MLLTHDEKVDLASDLLVDLSELLLAHTGEGLRKNDGLPAGVLLEVGLVLDVLIVAIDLLDVGHDWRGYRRGRRKEGRKKEERNESQLEVPHASNSNETRDSPEGCEGREGLSLLSWGGGVVVGEKKENPWRPRSKSSALPRASASSRRLLQPVGGTGSNPRSFRSFTPSPEEQVFEDRRAAIAVSWRVHLKPENRCRS